MQNFQGIAFIWTQTYGKLFQICISVPLIFYRTIASLNFIHKLKLFLRIFNLSYRNISFARFCFLTIILFFGFYIYLPCTEYMPSIYWLPHIFWLPSLCSEAIFLRCYISDILVLKILFLGKNMNHIYRLQKQPSRRVLRKRCSENMRQIYSGIPKPQLTKRAVLLSAEIHWQN